MVASNLFTQTNGFDTGAYPVINLTAGRLHLHHFRRGRRLSVALQHPPGRHRGQGPTPLTLGTAVSGVLEPSDHDAVYSFAANALDTLFFDPGTITGEVSWRLIDPNGNQVTGPQRPQRIQSVSLAIAGTYTILIEGRAGASGRSTYAFDAIITPTKALALTLGATVSAALTVPSEIDAYSFTLTAATQAVFDSLTNDGNLELDADRAPPAPW